MSLDHPDHHSYRDFTRPQRVDKAVFTLIGLLHGVAIDGELNAAEIAEVQNWCNEYRDLIKKAPFSELIPTLEQIQSDGIIDPEEQEDLLWLCRNLSAGGEFYDHITQEIQILQGILHGIMADDHVSKAEATALQDWIDEHGHLKGSYPFDEIDSLLMTVLADGVIDEEEQLALKDFFSDFIQFSFSKRVRDEASRVKSGLSKRFSVPGICATCPEIAFDGKVFTFTGTSAKGTRKQVEEQVATLGGQFSRSLLQGTDFLVICSGTNPCWTFSCHGRKVEQAVQYRKDGHPIIIVHESDFWDAVEDHS
jgi:hypothetical protein